jgi:hypothetical protein
MAQQLPWASLFFMLGGWPWLVWGIAVRVAICVTGHWLVGYFAHNRGPRSWHIQGACVQGYNVPWCGLITMGEAWHNNHHAFPASARLGLNPGETDPGWWVLVLLSQLGLVWNLKTPDMLPPRPNLVALGNDALIPRRGIDRRARSLVPSRAGIVVAARNRDLRSSGWFDRDPGPVLLLVVAWALSSLAFRRAADAGVSEWIAAYAFVPVIQIPVILFLSFCPSRRQAELAPEAGEAVASAPTWVPAAQGVLAGIGVTLFAVAVGALVFRSYGFGMFVISPFRGRRNHGVFRQPAS